jgi:hypothetical protein
MYYETNIYFGNYTILWNKIKVLGFKSSFDAYKNDSNILGWKLG